MASSQIEAFIYANTALIESNANMISEALDHKLLGEDYPISLEQPAKPKTYAELDAFDMVPRHGDLVSYNHMAYGNCWDKSTPKIEDFVKRVFAVEPFWIESMSTQLGLNGDVIPEGLFIRYFHKTND